MKGDGTRGDGTKGNGAKGEPAAARAITFMEALPCPLLVVGGDSTIAYANPAAEYFFATSASVLQRSQLADVVAFSSPLFALLDQVRETQSPVTEYAVNIGTPRTGGERLVDVQAAPVADDPASVLLMVVARAAAERLDRQLTHRKAARAVSGLASVLAHEIKNPLSGIRGAAQLLETSLPGDDRELTRLICTETDRIRDLVDQMEVFSDDRLPPMEPVNLHTVLDHARTLALAGFARGVSIRQEYDPSLPPALANRDQLIQVFINLLKNAAEAITAADIPGEIVLQTAFRPGVRMVVAGSKERISLPLEVCVHDNGAGVPDDLASVLFDPFVTSKSTGKGLGLALVAKIVRDHGGVVDCRSEGRRTTFRLLLPTAPEGAKDR
jgi:two-component system nitrogen regulation sensor histidine kinase GlnL